MECSVEKGECRGIPVAYLRGDVDETGCLPLAETIARYADPDTHCVIIELSQVTYIDSTGVGALFDLQRRLMERGGHLAVVCCNPPLERLLTETGFDAVFALYDSIEEAAEALPACVPRRA